MKKLLLTVFFCATMLFVNNYATAQQSGFGIGGMLGEPTGLSMKGWISETSAIDLATTFSLREDLSSFYVHADYLMHHNPADWSIEEGNLGLFYGAGVAIELIENLDDIVSIRIPGGTMYQFDDLPVDIFFEVGPVIEVSPDVAFRFGGGLGMRYFLN